MSDHVYKIVELVGSSPTGIVAEARATAPWIASSMLVGADPTSSTIL